MTLKTTMTMIDPEYQKVIAERLTIQVRADQLEEHIESRIKKALSEQIAEINKELAAQNARNAAFKKVATDLILEKNYLARQVEVISSCLKKLGLEDRVIGMIKAEIEKVAV